MADLMPVWPDRVLILPPGVEPLTREFLAADLVLRVSPDGTLRVAKDRHNVVRGMTPDVREASDG